ncbi:hypothetical protein BJ741DRAFT_599047 [Chytriomyces cf. hyalinus JEL632]|nr:hypothetical protein BJ741DRAFT_599047 [Chytriomyces cf. hyalinus JEL632]
MTTALPSPTPSDTVTRKDTSRNNQRDVHAETSLQMMSQCCDSTTPLPPCTSSRPPSLSHCPSQSGDDEISLFDFSVAEHREQSSREDDVELSEDEYDEGGGYSWDSTQPVAASGDSISDLIDCLLRPSQSNESLSHVDSSLDFVCSDELDTLSAGSNISLPNVPAQSGDVIDQLLGNTACKTAVLNQKSANVETDGSSGCTGDELASLLDPNKTLSSLLTGQPSLAGSKASGSSQSSPANSNSRQRKGEDPLAFLDAICSPEPKQTNADVSLDDIFSHFPIPHGGSPLYDLPAASVQFSTIAASFYASKPHKPRNWRKKVIRETRMLVLAPKAVEPKTLPVTERTEPQEQEKPKEPDSQDSQAILRNAGESSEANPTVTSTEGPGLEVDKSTESGKPVLRRSRRPRAAVPVKQTPTLLPRPDTMPLVQLAADKKGKEVVKSNLKELPPVLPLSAFNFLEECPIRKEFVCPWPECGHGAARRYNIKMHYLTHVPLGHEDAEDYLKAAGVPVEACNFCDKVFRRRFDLHRHLKKMHSIKVLSDGTQRLENGLGMGRGKKRKSAGEWEMADLGNASPPFWEDAIVDTMDAAPYEDGEGVLVELGEERQLGDFVGGSEHSGSV